MDSSGRSLVGCGAENHRWKANWQCLDRWLSKGRRVFPSGIEGSGALSGRFGESDRLSTLAL